MFRWLLCFGAAKGPHFETNMIERTIKHLVTVLKDSGLAFNWRKRPEKLDRGSDTVPTCPKSQLMLEQHYNNYSQSNRHLTALFKYCTRRVVDGGADPIARRGTRVPLIWAGITPVVYRG